MRFDVLDLLALVALAGVLWGYCVPLGRELWRRTLVVDRRWAARQEERRRVRMVMREEERWG